MVRTQYASGRAQLDPPTVQVLSGGATTAASAGLYSIYLQAQNNIGYNLPTTPVEVSLAAGQRLSVTIPITSLQSGEQWRAYVITAKKNNGLESVLGIYVLDETSALPLTVTFSRDAHLAVRQSVTADENLPTASDLVQGMVRRITSRNQVFMYRADSTEPVNNITVLPADIGRWVLFPVGFSTHIASTTDEFGSDQEIGQTTEAFLVPQLPYSGDGTPGPSLHYWIVNNTDIPVVSGTRLGFFVYANGIDFSDQFVGLFQIELLGHVDLETGVLDDSDSSGTGLMYGVNVVKTYQSAKTDIFLSKDLGPNEAVAVRVFPEYFVYQLPNTLPANSLLTFYPFFYQSRAEFVEAGYLFGDVIYDELQRRRILPTDDLALRVLSGGGLISGYSFRRAASGLVSFIQSNTTNQRILISVNGDCYPGVAESDTERIRAVVSTQEGVSNPSGWTSNLATTDADPTFTVSLTYPTSIRANYPTIGGTTIDSFAASEVVFYVLNVGANQLRTFSEGVIYDSTAPQVFQFDWSEGEVQPNTTRPVQSDTLFNFYNTNIADAAVQISSPGTGTNYRISYAWKYVGITASKISHDAADGCIQEMQGRVADLLTRPIVERFTDLLDTPNSLIGHATKAVRVSDDGQSITFGEPSDGAAYLPCRAAAIVNVINRSGLLNVDGVALVAGDRLLLSAQLNPAENGIYIVSAGAWIRAGDLDTAAKFVLGKYVLVRNGVVNGDTLWFLTTPVETLEVSPITWRPIRANMGSAGSLTFLGLIDTPSSYFQQENKWVRVNPGGTGLIFTDGPEEVIRQQYRQFAYVMDNGELSFIVAGNAPVMVLQDLE